jgi:hypothetical protein
MQGEYRGDFTRDTFNPAKHFSRVLMQQGRVQLDADWNEQAAILLHRLRRQAADLIGQHGGAGTSFQLEQLKIDFPAGTTLQGDFIIDPGDYYVDGILCENNNPVLTVQPYPSTQQNGNTSQVAVIAGFNSQSPAALASKYVELSSDNFVSVKRVIVSAVDSTGLILTLPASLSMFGFTSQQSLSLRRLTTYLNQPDRPVPGPAGNNNPALANYLVYLDVWERHLTCVEDGWIREVALGGPDTATRAKVVWQVKAIPGSTVSDGLSGLTSASPAKDRDAWFQSTWPKWLKFWQPDNRGLLKARVQPQPVSTDPCTMSPSSSYRGAENQLYRVEIHGTGGASTTLDANGNPTVDGTGATFKWSRENGSVIFPILNLPANSTIVGVAHLGRDERLSLTEGDWVEVVDDDYALSGATTARLYLVQLVDRVNLQVTVTPALSGLTGTVPGKHPFLRRWDQKSGDPTQNGLTLQQATGAAFVEESTANAPNWLNLEDGIQIQFQPGGSYRAGDYWLIPARVATGDIEWPRLRDAQGNLIMEAASGQPVPDALPPHGVEHHYAPLAVLFTDPSTGVPTDLRRTFTGVATQAT